MPRTIQIEMNWATAAQIIAAALEDGTAKTETPPAPNCSAWPQYLTTCGPSRTPPRPR